MGGSGLAGAAQTSTSQTPKAEAKNSESQLYQRLGTPSTNTSNSGGASDSIPASSSAANSGPLDDGAEGMDLKSFVKARGFTDEAETQPNVQTSEPRPSDSNQWIRYPPLIQKITARGDDDNGDEAQRRRRATDPDKVSKKLGDKDIGILNDCLNMWSKAVEQLLEKLKGTIPAEGMIGEVHYWRDLSRILDGISAELKQPQVEMTL